MSLATQHHLIVVIDGECIMCSKFAKFVVTFNPDARLIWAQNDTAKEFLKAFNISFENVMRSIVVVRRGNVFRGSDAFIQILLTMPWYLRLVAYSMMIFPRPLRELVYNWVATNRYDLFGKYETCTLPSKEIRSKFLH